MLFNPISFRSVITAAAAAGYDITGGTTASFTSASINYKSHTFTGNDTLTVTSLGGASSISTQLLVVAGGGGGGWGNTAGGGGAGGLVYSGSYSLATGTYTIKVGGGGNGATTNTSGSAGASSSFDTVVAVGVLDGVIVAV